ncbi:Nif3-like dinuclear metal center hexameric protein [Deinococcus sp.]|uniref:Nif3-like dinuclear metal center hexameric protein n=1 Tax=Deinococcus sp. TaxID=47478 RepID=UPI003CC65231
MPAPPELLTWLQTRLGDAALLRDGPPQIGTLALALSPGDLPPDLEADALFLHRAFRLGNAFPGLGVLASHDGFDAELTTGANLALARRLGWTQGEVLHWRGRVLGLKATAPERGWADLQRALEDEFGGLEELHEPAPSPSQSSHLQTVALINALRPDLLDFVAESGVQVCVTGQMRSAALPRARELGLGIVALGHRRSELRGLRQLGRELAESFPALHVRVYGEA